MAPEQMTLEQVIESARHLTPREKAQLIAQIIPDVEAMLAQVDAGREPLRSVYGLCRDLGPAPSANDIDEARQELFKDFSRTDIARLLPSRTPTRPFCISLPMPAYRRRPKTGLRRPLCSAIRLGCQQSLWLKSDTVVELQLAAFQ